MTDGNISETNVERIIRLEEETERDRRLPDRIADAVGLFAGTLWFIFIALIVCGVWIALNLRGFEFDPFPFGLLDTVVAIVALILTSFVLIRQNHMGRRANLRNHLALQINLLAEQEATKVLQVLQKLSEKLGVADQVVDRDADELAGDTSIEKIVENLRETISDPGRVKTD